MKEYYVYVYLDTRNPGKYIYEDLEFNYEPFYVGKGKNRRYKDHYKLRLNNIGHFYHKLNSMINDGFVPEIIFIKDNMSEDDAFRLEIEMIKKIGKISNNTGTLTNLTDGGEGSSGIIFSIERREHLSKIKTGKKMTYLFSDSHPMKDKSFDEFFGVERSNEIKKIISKNAKPPWKNRNLTIEIKEKISNTLKDRFKNKENHPNYGKPVSEESKDKISKSLLKYFQENPKVVTDKTKQKQSLSSSGSNNSSFTIYRIKDLETNEILTFYGTEELRDFITKFKIEKKLGKTSSPSFNLIIKGKNEKYFNLFEKIYPNRKN